MAEEDYRTGVVLWHADLGCDWAQFLGERLGCQKYVLKIALHAIGSDDKDSSLVGVVVLCPDAIDTDSTDVEKMRQIFADYTYSLVILCGVSAADYYDWCKYNDFSGNIKFREAGTSEDEVRLLMAWILETYDTALAEENIYDFPAEPRQVHLTCIAFPDHIRQPGETVALVFNSDVDGMVSVSFSDNSERIHLQHENKGTHLLRCPRRRPGVYSLLVSVNNEVVTTITITYLSQLDDIRSILSSATLPVQLMCQAMGLDETDNRLLDDIITANAEKHRLPLYANSLLQLSETYIAEDSAPGYYPSILHFAAQYNLKKLAYTLLQYPVAINACCMENANGHVPADIAIKAGHNDMGIMLDEFCKRKYREWKDHKHRSDIDSGVPEEVEANPKRRDHVNSGDEESWNGGPRIWSRDTEEDDESRRASEPTNRYHPIKGDPGSIAVVGTSPLQSNKIDAVLRKIYTRNTSIDEGQSSIKITKEHLHKLDPGPGILSRLGRRIFRHREGSDKGKKGRTTRKAGSLSPSERGERYRNSSDSNTSFDESMERDSGSYDEEGTVPVRRAPAPLKKHLSVRVSRALNEKDIRPPSLPPRQDKRSRQHTPPLPVRNRSFKES